MKKTLFVVLLSVWALNTAVVAETPVNQPPVLAKMKEDITNDLKTIDGYLAEAARSLAKADLKEEDIRKILNDLYKKDSAIYDCALVDLRGVMTIIEPKAYKSHEGKSISSQPHVIRLRAKGTPVLSDVFRSMEGFDAVSFAYPIFSEEKKITGSVSLLLRLDSLSSRTITSATAGIPLKAWVMQKDGRIIFKENIEEIGRNLFTDLYYQEFPELLTLGKQIADKEVGAGSYNYYDRSLQTRVYKSVYWTTFGLHDGQYRLVMEHTLAGGSSPNQKSDASKAEHPAMDDLRKLSKDSALIKNISEKKADEINSIFREFCQRHYGIYSVQWISPEGINVGGYPKENSLSNYDFRAGTYRDDTPFLKIVESQKEAFLECPLLEGKTGQFHFVPVMDGERFIGMIYFIYLKI